MNKIEISEAKKELNKVLLMMNYDSSKTLSENLISERDAVTSNSGDMESLKSLLKLEGPFKGDLKNNVLIKSESGKIVFYELKTNNGVFAFFQLKPGGFWSQQNFVIQNLNNKSRLGTFSIESEKLFMKTWETPVNQWFMDQNFDEVIRFSELKNSDTSAEQKCPEGQVKNKEGKCVPVKTDTEKTKQFTDRYIREAQSLLGFTGKDIDGKFGPKTLNQLKSMEINLDKNKK